jgi:hypothetical protein
MERIFTLREKHLAKAVRQRLLGDYRFDVREGDLLFGLGEKRFSLSRDYVVEAPDLSRVADVVAQALSSNHSKS